MHLYYGYGYGKSSKIVVTHLPIDGHQPQTISSAHTEQFSYFEHYDVISGLVKQFLFIFNVSLLYIHYPGTSSPVFGSVYSGQYKQEEIYYGDKQSSSD